MGAAPKLSQNETVESAVTDTTPAEPEWKQKKSKREKLLRSIKAKFYVDTIRRVIRSEIKKDD